MLLRGPVTLSGLPRLQEALERAPEGVVLDLSETGRLDTAGAWAILNLRERLGGLEIAGAGDAHRALLATVEAALPQPDRDVSRRRTIADWLEGVGRSVAGHGRTGAELTGYLGLFLARIGASLRHPTRFRLTALVHHCEDVGLRAVPIVALMSFLIGVVLAFQGAFQLRRFGAEIYVIDLIAVAVLRELGILLTAIVVAGRTASAFTAAIGSMKMREEVDAMQTLGIDPTMALIVPRVLALVLMLPILGLISNLAGLLGGALMSWIELGISPAMFQSRLVEGTSINHVFVGLSKAPVFALIIGIVGCHAGMQVRGNAESLGLMTSKAVVTAIFAVILADALFSVFFAKVGI
ncbi:ABC transporter permease [Rhodovulum imhoffii]|nr:ABC transporter permease [Rhodovulum imhoffii]